MTDITLEHVIRLADQLSATDKQALVDHLGRHLRAESSRSPLAVSGCAEKQQQSLRGIWRDCFPADLDLDLVLHEIRHEWEGEWPEAFRA